MSRKEVWLRGMKIDGLSPLLQPVADALLEAREEINLAIENFPDELLWKRPSDVASVGFHLKHIIGFLDRLMTYAEGKSLTEEQFIYLSEEQIPVERNLLLKNFNESIDIAINRLKNFKEEELFHPRKVGRAGLPTTVIGLCVHSAEHTMRHTGQLLVTIRLSNPAQ